MSRRKRVLRAANGPVRPRGTWARQRAAGIPAPTRALWLAQDVWAAGAGARVACAVAMAALAAAVWAVTARG